MVKHVVMFKLKDPSQENILKAAGKIRSMDGNIPVLKYLEVGIDFLRSERSCDLMLVAQFNNRDDLKIYASHPVHLPVLEYLKGVVEEIKVVDYEV
ncbi:MAG: Dabb family protein [Halanaerobiales bacterium]|nr:Dabb family protein [Halanaerobiales bacterium]